MRILIVLIATAVLLACAEPVLAHIETASPLPRAVEWSWEPWVVGPLAISALAYGAGLVRLFRRLGGMRLIGWREAAAYAAGLVTLAIALVSPLDSIAGQLFWVHMTQHLLLMLVAAPLLVVGRPAVAFLWAFGPRGRKQIGMLWSRVGLRRGVDALMHPIAVWVLFCGAFVFWHFPGPYQAALRDEGVHTLEHLSFLVTALMFWSIVIEPSGRRRLGYGSTLVFVVTAAVVSGLPGALITLAPRPLYPAHAEGVAAWGLTLLQDQQLAGLVMWIPGGFVFVAAVGYVFVKWLQQGEGPRPGLVRRVTVPALIALLLPILLGGSGNNARAADNSNQARAAALVRAYGCGACHTIPGIAGADGMVGPPLIQMGRRVYIAGMLRNTPDNMVEWLRHPQRIVPGNAMPDMGLGEADARVLATYLGSLR